MENQQNQKHYSLFEYLEKYINLVNKAGDLAEQVESFPYLFKDVKSNQEADKLRLEGNQYFKSKNYIKALELYSRSLAFAEANSKSMAYAYGNRSAVLFEKCLYNECLEDIKRALANHYPKESIEKIMNRQEKAIAMNLKGRVIVLHSTLPEIPVQERNKLIQCAANSVKIAENKEMGRHIIATRKIKMGEVIAIEKPFVTALLSQRFLNCYECMLPCFNMIPCPSCTVVMFCNKKCRASAWKRYHKYECHILGMLFPLCKELGATLKIALSIRDYSEFERVRTARKRVYRSDRYVEILELCTNSNMRSETFVRRLIHIALMVFRFVKEHTDFFTVLNFPKAEEIFKGITLKLLFISPTNFHQLTKLISDDGLFETTEEIGGASYAFLSLFNHSCDPNVFVTRYGTTKVMRARRNIDKDEQLFDNYGAEYPVQNYERRRFMLMENFFFDCHCTPCKYRWPLMDELTCFTEIMCSHIMYLREIVSNNEDDLTLIRKIFEELISLASLNWIIPSYEWQLFQDTFDECCLNLGNKKITL